jgi:hypothetical protein
MAGILADFQKILQKISVAGCVGHGGVKRLAVCKK